LRIDSYFDPVREAQLASSRSHGRPEGDVVRCVFVVDVPGLPTALAGPGYEGSTPSGASHHHGAVAER